MHTGTMLTDAIRQWPTPTASEQSMRTTKRVPSSTPGAGAHGKHLSAEVLVPETWMAPMLDGAPAYPTPTASTFGSSQNEGQVPHERRTRGTPSLTTAASRGLLPSLPAPPTSTDGTSTSALSPSRRLRLNVAFVELLMGWPTGWTIPHATMETADMQSLYHVDRLRLLGNGVVPQQAAFALRHLVAALEAAWAR